MRPAPAKGRSWKNDRAPLVFIAGSEDHLSPPAISKANVRKYANSTAVTEYKEYPGPTHNTVGQMGWEEVADYAIGWASKYAKVKGAVAVQARRSSVLTA